MTLGTVFALTRRGSFASPFFLEKVERKGVYESDDDDDDDSDPFYAREREKISIMLGLGLGLTFSFNSSSDTRQIDL